MNHSHRLALILVLALIFSPFQIQPAAAQGQTLVSTTQVVAPGMYHTCFLNSAGGVQCWGGNIVGQLGSGDFEEWLAPVSVPGFESGVSAVASGTAHSCAVKDGEVWCWGANAVGQLGDGTQLDSPMPVKVAGMSGVTAVSAGFNFSCALTSTGEVWCWGGNAAHQLGDDSSQNFSKTPVRVLGLPAVIQRLTSGYIHSCVIDSAGGAWCWGDNDAAQLGDGTQQPRSRAVRTPFHSGVTAISGGVGTTCAVVNGGVQCWGANGYGQIGNGDLNFHPTPVAVTGLGSGVEALAVGGYHVCALLTGGSVRCWGNNSYGQVGDSTTADRSTPIPVSGLSSGVVAIGTGEHHSCAVNEQGAVSCWGRNNYDQLGEGAKPRLTRPAQILSLNNIQRISGSFSHACAIQDSGQMWCWGADYFGQLGDGNTISSSNPKAFTTLTNLREVATGMGHTCVRDSAGAVWCWGLNWNGQLGNSTTQNSFTPTNVLTLVMGMGIVGAGSTHSCAAWESGGYVSCWGRNNAGQLGNTSVPLTQNNMVIGVMNLAGALKVDGGIEHTCAVDNMGVVSCWGGNSYGQQGNNSSANNLVATPVNGMSGGAVDVDAGNQHTCAVKNGQVYCWGTNTVGQLGDGTTTQRGEPVQVPGLTNMAAVAAGGYHSCALSAGGEIWCWGGNYYGQLGNGTIDDSRTPVKVEGMDPAVAITTGETFSCALDVNGKVWCWGSDREGELGDGKPGYRVSPVEVAGLSSVPVISVNFTGGQPGSVFRVVGFNFPPGEDVSITANGVEVAVVRADDQGAFILNLTTLEASPGLYEIAASLVGGGIASVVADQSRTIAIVPGSGVRPQEGGAQAFGIPSGIAVDFKDYYLPLISH